ncbi:MAG TPA: hypothetical protein VNU20_06555 [Candidatus Sulfotelmatobacter sp.]|jgi:hypothetical protein|nr:hypothetical protein [Candidatus Sulfotelmatobacter sp.]
MFPKTKVTILFMGMAFPYLIFVLFFALRATPGSANPFPSWFPWVALAYMLGSISLASVLAPRFFRNVPPPPEAVARQYLKIAKGQTMALILLWAGLFIYGAYKTLRGDLPVERALPAGGFLLAFIGFFAWSLRRRKAAISQAKPSAPPDR